MEKANQILSSFLIQQRAKANLKTTDVALKLGCSDTQIEIWENRPVKAPICEIVKLVKMYKTSEWHFSKIIWQVQVELRKNHAH